MIRPPIVGAELWRRVMSAAEYRCECFGSCGSKHTPLAGPRAAGGGQRVCARPMVPGGVPLVVAPVDPAVSAYEAAAMPETELVAWCARCYSGAVAIARRSAKAAPEPTAGLFDAAPFRRSVGWSGRYRGGEVA